MATALSALLPTALVEHIEETATLLAKRLVLPGSLSPGDRVLAAKSLRLIRAQVVALNAVLRQASVVLETTAERT